MTNVRLRYTGELSVTFQHPSVGYVEQNGEFDVPEDEAEAFTRRADIESSPARPGRRRRRRRPGPATTAGPATPRPAQGDAGQGDPAPDA